MKMQTLLSQSQNIFHTQDLAVLWGTHNKNTLYTTIKRYSDHRILHPLQKGMYATLPPEKLRPFDVGLKALHQYGYVSCETILQQHGLMNALVSDIMLISARSQRFTIGPYSYHCRQLKDAFLFNPVGIEKHASVLQASLLRAIADMLYFNPSMHFDAPIDWSAVRVLQQQIGYPMTARS